MIRGRERDWSRQSDSPCIALICIWIGFVCSFMPQVCPAADESVPSREDRLLAGYLYNFAKFIEWPSFAPAEPLTVCFLGSPGVHAAFDSSMSGKLVGAHPLITRDIASRSAAAGCRMVFISASAKADLSRTAVPPAVLTVGDAPDFLAKGGIIVLFTQDNRLRFNVSIDNARQASLQIGSDLLQLAVLVEEKKR